MTTQFQILNKILQTKDYSLVLLNNLTEDYFPGYSSEFKFIKSHYEKFGTVPDRLTFLDTFPDFDIKDVNEPDSYLIEQVSKEYTTQYIARHFNVLKKLIEEDKIEELQKEVEQFRIKIPRMGRFENGKMKEET